MRNRLIMSRQALMLAVVLAHGIPANAMTFKTVDDTLFLEGEIIDTDYVKFNAAFSKQIHKVTLLNSPGGDLWTGMALGRAIKSRGDVDTIVAGQCLSACATIFMGGKNRYFFPGLPLGAEAIGIHFPYEQTFGDAIPRVTAMSNLWFKTQSQDKLQPLLDHYHADLLTHGGGLFIFPQPLPPFNAPVLHCKDDLTVETCQPVENATALSIGVVTTEPPAQ
ncbi:ATP-dependent Clp protease proteolytic subunit [Leeia oryzae]|uniref:ATP-dependent Clp protease proteolytic subunit n=1 Tax=Leeia oryzae TaxID=356662 RepID=UPI000378A08E|nr:ATP-dependent Clp protease proteolytic subunit [Leeia oryzae]